MSNRIWWAVIILLFVIIALLCWFLFATPASTPTTTQITISTSTVSTASTSSVQAAAPTKPTVSMPTDGATVGDTFAVAGIAPNTWFFEASFPIKITDVNDDTLGAGQAQAQTDWTVPGPVPFSATITLATTTYQGPATLVLLKDNESGLPQNDDSISIPIVIQ